MKGITNMEELRKRMLEHEEQLKKQVYIDGEHLVIDVEYKYEIELSRCDSLPKVLSWVTHLCEKTWMSTDILERFIRVSTAHHHLEIPDA